MAQQSEWDISVEDLKRMRDQGADFVLIDVREEQEFADGHLNGKLIPLGQLMERLGELDASAHTVVYCRSGGRSAHATQQLRGAGFQNAWNVSGGILAWSERIDPVLSKG
jgi:rhodanese-related sulfurtransferase